MIARHQDRLILDPRLTRRPRQRFRWWLILIAIIVGSGPPAISWWLLLEPAHRILPAKSLENAVTAVEGAEHNIAANRWTTPALDLSRRLLADAKTRIEVQKARREFLRDFRCVEYVLDAAQTTANWAIAGGEATEKSLKTMASAAIDEAVPILQLARRTTTMARLGRGGSKSVERARLALEEAKVRLEQGDYQEAVDLSTKAIDLAFDGHENARKRLKRFADPKARSVWRDQVAKTIDWSVRNPGKPAIVVSKEAHSLTVYVDGKVSKRFDVELGMAGMYTKSHAGDDATPEGMYRVVKRLGAGASKFYKALMLDYPNSNDRERFERRRRNGQLSKRARIGAFIEIHGKGGKGRDWTHGCMAVRNDDMDVLFAMIPEQTPVTIVPSDGNGGPITNAASQ